MSAQPRGKSSETVQALWNDLPERLIRFAWYLVDCMTLGLRFVKHFNRVLRLHHAHHEMGGLEWP